MSAELITMICNVATLGVLVAGAIAAAVQLRHVRAGTELQAVLAIEHSFAQAELQSALLFVQAELPEQLTCWWTIIGSNFVRSSLSCGSRAVRANTKILSISPFARGHGPQLARAIVIPATRAA